MYTVYIVECGDGSFYTGITTDIVRRFREHAEGRGGKYTRAKKVVCIVYTEKQTNKSDALKREMYIKSLNRKNKIELIKNMH